MRSKKEREKTKEFQVMECTNSLQIALQRAGGRCLSLKDLEEISLADFICDIAAQNSIRFIYKTEDDLMFTHKVYEDQDVYRILADVYRFGNEFHASSINCPGCIGKADSFPEALDNLKVVASNWISGFLAKQEPIEWEEDEEIQAYRCLGLRSTIFVEVKPPDPVSIEVKNA